MTHEGRPRGVAEVPSAGESRAQPRAGPASSEGGADAQLLVPASDVVRPEVSVVIPALNEELTITEFVAWCREGLERAGVAGEVLIVDSSTDRTAGLALEAGARVLKIPKRGLGRAYMDAIPYVRGDFVLMGDADCTYDFRDVGGFVDAFRAGYEFVMGSRFRGSIEPGSMPALHRWFGTPVTTWILNRLYSSRFSDIHCGMRGITLDALRRMELSSESWEYASEMVLKSVRLELRTTEVPVRFLKDKEGRLSHHKRSGWSSPWKAAWINLRAMFVHGADFFVFKPGIVLLVIGLLVTVPLATGPRTVGRITFSLYSELLGVALSLLGLQSFFMGCLARVVYDGTGEATGRWRRMFPYTRTVVSSGAAFAAGLFLTTFLIADFFEAGLKLPPVAGHHHLAVAGLLLMMAGFMTFTFTLVLHATALEKGKGFGRQAR